MEIRLLPRSSGEGVLRAEWPDRPRWGRDSVQESSGPHSKDGINRREFTRRAFSVAMSTVAGSGLTAALGARRARAQTKSSGEVVVCTWGGSYTESQKKAFFDPFEQETGI